MISSLLLEAALRSVLLALAVWTGLRVVAVRNVVAQKAAWGLVLASALLMPLVLPLAARIPAAIVIPARALQMLDTLRPSRSLAPQALAATASLQTPDQPPLAAKPIAKPHAAHQSTIDPETIPRFSAAESAIPSLDHYPAPSISQSPANSSVAVQRETNSSGRRFSLVQLAALVYIVVAALLFFRLLYGLVVAIDVWQSAKPVLLDPSPLTHGLHLRASDAVSSPVTIGSAIVLPTDYSTWESEKLRIVLAHERSHIRQGDFYLQLLAGIYAALVWFSPLGWWLKCKLSDLAEAISDRAGLEEAADRTSYAQVLLQFAATPRPTLIIGVAMARSGSLSRRIERLLNDVSFRQAFSGSRRALATVLVIPVALFAATALVRVQAAGQAPAAPAMPAPPSAAPSDGAVVAPAAPTTGVSTPQQIHGETAPEPPAPAPPAMLSDQPSASESAPAVAPQAPAEGPSVLTVAPVAPSSGPFMVIPKAPGSVPLMILPPHAPGGAGPMAIIAPRAGLGAGYGYGVGQSTANENGSTNVNNNGKHSGYHSSNSSNGESYAVIHGNDKDHVTFSGDWNEGRREELEKARKLAGGKDILWFTRNGKSYFVDDPGTLEQIKAMYLPMEELGKEQEALGKRQEELGKQQSELDRQQEQASVPTPDMSKQIAEIDAAMAKLKANQGKAMTQEQFAEIQEKLAELQGSLGEIQGQIGASQGEFGQKMGRLGAMQGELGAKQGRLGAEQGRLAQEADRKVKSIIDESLKNGKAHPVE